MDIFEYLPQLIVAYDSDDEFANLIHVKKANGDNDYYCPCCGGIVKPRALDSNKEQSHYYHKTGKCTKESQLHFFCKNWLFEEGSKFYVNNELYEVSSIEIEKSYDTPFGNYKPDITVYTKTGKVIYFEMFFANRKTGDDYFCKWDALGNDVIEVNIKEYMYKTDTTTIPSFTYLYHEGVCYSKPYIKRDLYANTIARIKRDLTRQKVLNYKARIEQLDWFWQEIRNNSKEVILNIVSKMKYDDMVSCYEIIKRKQCVLYLKDDILNIINQKVISEIRESLNLPKDEHIYFDLECIRGRTYKAGIRLNLKTEHIIYDKVFSFYDQCYEDDYFNKLKDFPKVVFNKNIFSVDEINISNKQVKELEDLYNSIKKHKEEILKYENELSEFEKEGYKVRMVNDRYTILMIEGDAFKLIFENRYIKALNIKDIKNEIEMVILDNQNREFIETLFNSNEYNLFLSSLKNHDSVKFGDSVRIDIQKYIKNDKSGIKFKMYICNKCFFNQDFDGSIDSFIEQKEKCENIILDFMKTYNCLLDIVERINNSKNSFWKAKLSFNHNSYITYPIIEINQKRFKTIAYMTLEKFYFKNYSSLDKEEIVYYVETTMKKVLKNMEYCGCRVMEVRD